MNTHEVTSFVDEWANDYIWGSATKADLEQYIVGQLAERENAIQSEVYAERMRADGLRKQLDAANARIAELELMP